MDAILTPAAGLPDHHGSRGDVNLVTFKKEVEEKMAEKTRWVMAAGAEIKELKMKVEKAEEVVRRREEYEDFKRKREEY